MQDNFLSDQVSKLRQSGASTEVITDKLRSSGWSEEIIKSALSQGQSSNATAPLPNPAPKSRRKLTAYAAVLGLVLAALSSSNIFPSLGNSSHFIMSLLSVTQQQDAGDFHTHEDLGNGYALFTSKPHGYSFQVSSDLKFYAPTGESRPDSNFAFQSKKRGLNSVFLYTVSAEPAKDTCSRFSNVNPNWKPTTINGYSAIRSSASRIGQTTILCTDTQDVTFSYDYDWFTRNGEVVVKEKIPAEQESYERMIDSFKIIDKDKPSI